MRLVSLIFLAACSRAGTSADSAPAPVRSAESTISQSDARAPTANASQAVDAGAPARANCAEPTRLVQLGTVKEGASFQDELLVGKEHAYDPETLAQSAVPPAKSPSSTKTKRYAEVAGGFGLVLDANESEPVVESIDTHKVVTKPETACAAGGAFGFSLSPTGRFLLCTSSRAGLSFIDLRAPQKHADSPWDDLGEGAWLAPNDHYAVEAPVIGWGTSAPTRQDIVHLDLDTKKSKKISHAPLQALDDNNPKPPENPYDVAFCGDGSIFVASAEKEVAVFRGADGSRLASVAAMKGGRVSFSASGRYVSQTRGNATTIFRLEP